MTFPGGPWAVMVVGRTRIMPYHASMSEVEYSPETEAEALKQFSDAFNKLKQEGVGGEDLYNQTLPLWRKYESIRKQREIDGWDRDGWMLRRGTYRGLAIALAMWLAFLAFRADTPVEGRYILGVVVAACLWVVWRLGRIPRYDDEDTL